MKNIIKNLEHLLDGHITAYKISKDTKINVSSIQRYINGERKIKNMTLETAEKLYNYYIQIKKGSN